MDAGQPAEGFWSLQARDFAAVLERIGEAREVTEQRADYRAGLVASMLYNANRKKYAQAKGPSDFFPELEERYAEEEGDLASFIGQLQGAVGGGQPDDS